MLFSSLLVFQSCFLNMKKELSPIYFFVFIRILLRQYRQKNFFYPLAFRKWPPYQVTYHNLSIVQACLFVLSKKLKYFCHKGFSSIFSLSLIILLFFFSLSKSHFGSPRFLRHVICLVWICLVSSNFQLVSGKSRIQEVIFNIFNQTFVLAICVFTFGIS